MHHVLGGSDPITHGVYINTKAAQGLARLLQGESARLRSREDVSGRDFWGASVRLLVQGLTRILGSVEQNVGRVRRPCAGSLGVDMQSRGRGHRYHRQ
jgi:hypothetical protein